MKDLRLEYLLQRFMVPAGLGLIGAGILLFYWMLDDWRWAFGYPVLFAVAYLWVKLWAWIAGVDRKGLTRDERARNEREDEGWN